MKSAILICALLAGALCVLSTALTAATYIVDRDDDLPDSNPGDGLCLTSAGGCSFRAALQEIAISPASDTVRFEPSIGLIRVQSTPVRISANNTVVAGSAGMPIIDGLFLDYGASLIVVEADSCHVAGITVRRARSHGVLIRGAHNRIGGTDPGEAVVAGANGISDPSGAGICIEGQAADSNLITGCIIGLQAIGSTADANRIGLLVTRGAHHNNIGIPQGGGNVISGNDSCGILFAEGASENRVAANLIGMAPGGLTGMPNGIGILVSSGARRNHIGARADDYNRIAGNNRSGIVLIGPQTSENTIDGNRIGLDASGRSILANGAWGVALLDGADSNHVGTANGPANFISGNDSGGICIRGFGTNYNHLCRNRIGLTERSIPAYGNGENGPGVVISESASHNAVGCGSKTGGNTISAHRGPGVLINGVGSSYNTVCGNMIGTDTAGRFYGSNAAGVVMRGGASSNHIGTSGGGEGNLISASLRQTFPMGAGVILLDPGTAFNEVTGNNIGTDGSGSRALPNRTTGVLIGNGASNNLIGGVKDVHGNVISGNGDEAYLPQFGRGIHVFGVGTSHNDIRGNTIGLRADSLQPLPNEGIGIAIVQGAADNTVGGDDVSLGNVISGNESHGIVAAGPATVRNRISHNSIYSNDSLGIMLQNGANLAMLPPLFDVVLPGKVTGSTGAPGVTVELYRAAPDPAGFGEGAEYIASAVSDDQGVFIIESDQLVPGDTLTALAHDADGNSSAFSGNVVIDPSLPVDDKRRDLPKTFALHQNYPNPFNPSTTVGFALASAGPAQIRVFNVNGQLVRLLLDAYLSAGEYQVEWDGLDETGRPVASGVYLYRLDAPEYSFSRKMLLLK